MLGSLVWLFPQYRELVEVNRDLVHQLETLRRSYEQLATTRVAASTPETLLAAAKDTIFADMPFPDGKIPDTAWLTPGEPERDTK